MRTRGRIAEYFIITGIVWCCYGFALPIYFVAVFDWTFPQIEKWWMTGTPVEFILAYPIGKLLWRVKDPVKNWCDRL